MFLDWIQKLGFLEHDPEASIFTIFPVETRVIIARYITDNLLSGVTPSQALSSQAHVVAIMEVVGQSFGLPVEEEKIIEMATELYKRWLLDINGARPPPFKAEVQHFIRVIFKHFSLLFLPRQKRSKAEGEAEQAAAPPPSGKKDKKEEKEKKVTKGTATTHARLCSVVLDIIQKAAQEVEFDKETWEELLKIMLGIADSLFNLPEGEVQIADILCPQTLKVLFDIWLRSRTRNDELWKQLKVLFFRWRHRMPAIVQWNATCFGMTNRVLRLLYGKTVGTDAVVIQSSDGVPVTITTLDPDYTYYSWFRMLHVITDPETIALPQNYAEAMKGIYNLTDLMLSIKQSPANGATARMPTGNTVLYLLGSWLFEAINNYEPGVKKVMGKVHAIEATLKLFCAHPRVDFDDTFLACFYRGINAALKTGNTRLLSVLLVNSTKLFACEFKGLRMLIPSYVAALARVLPEPRPLEGIHCPSTQLRHACIKILGCLVAHANYFGDIQFQPTGELSFAGTSPALPPSSSADKPPDLNSYAELNDHLAYLLLEGIKTEENPDNRQLLLWTAHVYLHENLHTPPLSFPAAFFNLILNKVMSGGWGKEVQLIAFVILSLSAPLFHQLSGRAPAGTAVDMATTLATNVVLTLCKYIENHCNSQTSKREPEEELIVEAFHALVSWIVVDQWLLGQPRALSAVLEVIDIGLTAKRGDAGAAAAGGSGAVVAGSAKSGGPAYFMPTDKIREAAETALVNLLNHLGQFPPPTGPSTVSGLSDEFDVIDSLKLPTHNVSTYIFDKTLISVVRLPRDGVVEIYVVLRDMSGKYVWHSRLNYFPPATTDVNLPDPAHDPADLRTVPTTLREGLLQNNEKLEPSERQFLEQLQALMDDETRRTHEAVLAQAVDRTRQEEALLKTLAYGLNVDVAERRPQPPPVVDWDTTALRLFMTHLGFNSLENRGRFHLVQSSPTRPFNFVQNFKSLDQTNERECIQVGVLFVPRGHATEDAIFEAEQGSEDFHDFLSNVGWTVAIESHKGFKGGLDAKVTGEVAPYYADSTTEMIFHVATLMPSNPGGELARAAAGQKMVHKKRLIYSDKVLITWAEDLDEYDLSTLQSRALMNIVVSPLKSKFLYRVRIIFPAPIASNVVIGPLLDEMIVGRQVLPTAVRHTALVANRILSGDSGKPLTIRKFLIEDFILRHKATVSLGRFYASFFTVPPEKKKKPAQALPASASAQ